MAPYLIAVGVCTLTARAFWLLGFRKANRSSRLEAYDAGRAFERRAQHERAMALGRKP